MQEVENKIKYEFKNKELLKTALTHSSYANEKNLESYERLEFLGDAILDFVAGEYLYRKNADSSEGNLTKRRAELVCEERLCEVARELDLIKEIKLSYGAEKTGVRKKPSIQADIIEAIIAAIYLDSGFENASKFVLENVISDEFHVIDYKSSLQELVQQDKGAFVTYELINEEGPDHNKQFTFAALVNGKNAGEGKGRTKREAEQNAAKQALEELNK